ncbi:MarC family protein [Pontibacter sp. G13]|uniref:MarC family protein n=1 Tax=Pontibacter sp. G13 TaxID=3074898 RepID=UPI00288AD6F4|nr:MarC family protein [Pontibacter sp. G13]WNJ19795.1 MarC family protein [Pontibacter sp. G13]
MIDWLSTFIIFFSVIDPIGTVPVFISVTSGRELRDKRRIAFQAAWVSALVLLFFIVLGELILDGIGIPISAFQIAGGIVLFLFALTMLFGESKPDKEIGLKRDSKEVAIFPLAMPSIASPGSMLAAVLLTKNAEHELWEQVQIAGCMLLVLGVTYGMMMLAAQIYRVIGSGGASILSRVMGLILASIAATNVLEGIKEYFQL